MVGGHRQVKTKEREGRADRTEKQRQITNNNDAKLGVLLLISRSLTETFRTSRGREGADVQPISPARHRKYKLEFSVPDPHRNKPAPRAAQTENRAQ